VVGETTCDPFTGTVVPFKSALTALLVIQVSVELLPATMDVGFALIPAVGGPLEVTVTLACADAVVPDEPVATKLYVVVDVGETDCDPLTATDAPFRVALAALVDVQVSVELLPDTMDVGLALIPAVGEPLEPTVTTVWAEACAPEELVATKVYVVVDAGETDCDPLIATDAPFRVALAALVDVQVSVELPPDGIEAGLALIPAVVTVTVTWPQSVAPVEL
jgi:uncharacterized protein (UPF0212 family)